MSSPTTNNTWSNTPGEEPATSSTKYSSDVEQAFGKLSLAKNVTNVGIEDPFTTNGVNESIGVAKLKSIIKAIGEGPAKSLVDRQHGGIEFGSDAYGNPLSVFVFAYGKHSIQDYHRYGKFGPILQYQSLVNCVVQHLQTHPDPGHFMGLFRFDDSRDAEKAIQTFNKLSSVDKELEGFKAVSISAEQYCSLFPFVANPGHLFIYEHGIPTMHEMHDTFVRRYDGQFVLQVEARPARGVELDHDSILDIAKDMISANAGVKAMVEVIWKTRTAPNRANIKTYLVELNVHKQVDEIVAAYQGYCHYFQAGFPCQALVIWATHMENRALSDFASTPGGMALSRDPSGIIHPLKVMSSFRSNDELSSGNKYLLGGLSSSRGRLQQARDNRPGPLVVKNRSPRALSNMVNWSDVVRGYDTRSTFMLRNIPSELSFHSFKFFLDQFVKYKYDFLYLRVDFSNNNNLGYGFINLDKATDILPFLDACVGELWPVPGTSKRVEVSYANVQTIPQIVEKFRNSSVMLEAPIARPHLYYLEGHPRAGEERSFPSPDNNQKQIRSSQNMRTFGLYRGGRLQRHSGKLDRGNPNSPTRSDFAHGHYSGGRYNGERYNLGRMIGHRSSDEDLTPEGSPTDSDYRGYLH